MISMKTIKFHYEWMTGIVFLILRGFGSSLVDPFIIRMLLVKYSTFLCKFQRLNFKIPVDFLKILNLLPFWFCYNLLGFKWKGIFNIKGINRSIWIFRKTYIQILIQWFTHYYQSKKLKQAFCDYENELNLNWSWLYNTTKLLIKVNFKNNINKNKNNKIINQPYFWESRPS